MCRSIKTLFNLQPAVTEEEIRAASLQFVRKLSGFNKPSKANEAAFLTAVDEIAASSGKLLSSLETNTRARECREFVNKGRYSSGGGLPSKTAWHCESMRGNVHVK